jgi:GT2 family glycosyltransferase
MIRKAVSIVIPTHNRREKLNRLLESILDSNYEKHFLEVIIVDDASNDDTADQVRRRFPGVQIIHNQSEKLLAASRNIGITRATGNYIFLIDDDNIMEKNCVFELLRVLDAEPSVGICGPITYYLGQRQRVWSAGVKTNMLTSLTRQINRDIIDTGQLDQMIECEVLINAFMVRRTVIGKIGLFDEKDFPIHYDEADFGERVRAEGYRIVCNPKAKVWHDMPLPETLRSKARLYHVHTEDRAYYAGRNRIVFLRKHARTWQFVIFILIFNWLVGIYYIAQILQSPLERRGKIVRAYVKGVVSGLRWASKLGTR